MNEEKLPRNMSLEHYSWFCKEHRRFFGCRNIGTVYDLKRGCEHSIKHSYSIWNDSALCHDIAVVFYCPLGCKFAITDKAEMEAYRIVLGKSKYESGL